MKTAVLTGGTGFVGFGLLSELVSNGVFVYVVVREGSRRMMRLQGMDGIKVIELSMDNISKLPEYVERADVFYHLAWEGERNDYEGQLRNINGSVDALKAAHQLGVKQFIVTGSQAEYGICKERTDEDTPPKPTTAYGACKLACYDILRTLAEQIGMSLTWVRVYSVYGNGDNPNTLISYLFKCFKDNQTPRLTSGTQYWEFLYLEDAARALYLFGQTGKTGIYNLSSGFSMPLRQFIIEARDRVRPDLNMEFNPDAASAVELRSNIDKIKRDLNWEPRVSFLEGIRRMVSINL